MSPIKIKLDLKKNKSWQHCSPLLYVYFTHLSFKKTYLAPEKPTNQQWVSQHLIRVTVLLFNHLFLTSASGRTLPGSNFSDKTPQGRWALTEVTHTVAPFQSNHNSMFHFKGLISHFWMRGSEPSPLMKTEGAMTPPEPINTTRGVTTRCWAVSRSTSDNCSSRSRRQNATIGLEDYSGQKGFGSLW